MGYVRINGSVTIATVIKFFLRFTPCTPSGNRRKNQLCQQSVHMRMCSFEQTKSKKAANVAGRKAQYLSGRREKWKYA